MAISIYAFRYPSDFHVEDYINHQYNKSQGIPKIMHHCWKNETIPDEWLPGYTACLGLNPEYTHMLWTHDKIDKFFKTEYPWFFDRFDLLLSFPPLTATIEITSMHTEKCT